MDAVGVCSGVDRRRIIVESPSERMDEKRLKGTEELRIWHGQQHHCDKVCDAVSDESVWYRLIRLGSAGQQQHVCSGLRHWSDSGSYAQPPTR